jgi:hypothetical protein
MCDCRSYNKATGTVPEVVLKRPDWLPDGQRINGVPVDACIADTVQYLWDSGVVTMGSCCGHNKECPSLVLGNGERDYKHIFDLLAEYDSRKWQLLQWQLVEVNL